ncbi:DUF362 domain-containing protein [Chloroflexota bacterium]
MGTYVAKTEHRREFVRELLSRLGVAEQVRKARRILVKPNIVSHELYPTTTHPEVLSACLEVLIQWHKEIVVADGPAIDAGNSEDILNQHPLKKVCDSFAIPVIDLTSEEMTTIVTQSGMELEVTKMVFDYDFIVSLPVLKSHGICFFTGALKNQFGFFSTKERVRLHLGKDILRAIAEVNAVIKPSLFIVDAVETLIKTNERRHGGIPIKLGYMLGGTDPLSLDAFGLQLLGQLDLKLRGKSFQDIPYLAYAAKLAIGDPQAQPLQIQV